MIPTFALAASLMATPGGHSQLLSSDDIGRAVLQQLALRLQEQGRPAAKVRLGGRITDQQLPAGTPEIIVGRIAGAWPRVRAGVPVHVQVDGRTVRTTTVWVEIDEPRTVLTYAKPYQARQVGSAIEARSMTVNMACCNGDVAAATADLNELRTSRSVRAGAPILLSDFEHVPEVAAHTPVEVEVSRGGVRIATAGTAVADGRVGDRVTVRTGHHALVHGLVVGRNRVKVDE